MRRFHRPSTPTALALIALTVSLSGTGFAFARSSSDQAVTPAAAASWHTLTLRNGWSYADFDSFHAAYFKDGNGVVHLRGSAAGGTDGAAVFQLPTGSRPKHTVWLTIYAFDGAAGGLEIKPTGKAFVFDTTGSDTDVLGYSSFDGVTFPTS